MIQRKEFLKELIKWKDRQNGVTENQIIAINFEELEYEELCDYKKLYDYIKSKLLKDKITYIFLDEIQKVNDFEKVIDSLYVKERTDIYITGSNAYFLSGNLATYLTGRYVEILVLPLSFKEYKEISNESIEISFSNYMKYGGMPFIASMKKDIDKAYAYMEGIYNTVIVKDIEDRINWQAASSDKRKLYDVLY